MRLILTLILASIVLLSCADSKENKTTITTHTPTTRSVAQFYRISTGEKGTVDCFPDITKKKDVVYTLSNGLHVALASGNKVTISVDGTQWLHIYKDENKTLPCYVQTQYLNPVPSH